MDTEIHDIGYALKWICNYYSVFRTGWDKDMSISLQLDDKSNKRYIAMWTWYGIMKDWRSIPWVCSQEDLLATDWQVVIEE